MELGLMKAEQFVRNQHYPDVVRQVELSKLYDLACKLESCSMGESIQRVIKMYNLKPAKKKKQKN